MVDLDGTLIDTTEANYQAYKAALTEYGYELSRDYYIQNCFGHSYKDFLPAILGADSSLLERVHEKKNILYKNCFCYAEVNFHLVNILTAIRSEYYLALVTTASKANVTNILQHFKLDYLFDAIVTQEDMSRNKPAPDCYIKTREKFGISPINTIIFEDSPVGMTAALGSGCSTFCYKK